MFPNSQVFELKYLSYTRAWGLRYQGLQLIGNYDLKSSRQIFSIYSNVNLPRENDFLYQFF